MNTNKEELSQEENLSVEAQEVQTQVEVQETSSEEVEVKKEDKDEKSAKKSFFGKKQSKEDTLKQQIAALEEEKMQLNDKFLRLFSEFENYKKRTNKEKLELISTASERVLVALLSIVDDFERASQYNKSAEDINAVKEGFDLIYHKMQTLLKQFEVEEIVAKDEVFDTDFHEAVTHFPAQDEAMKGKVMDVVEKGYKLKDKVIRFSKVVIAN